MEDPRLSRMYASMMTRGLGGLWDRLGRWLAVNATRLLWLGVLFLVILLPLGWAAHLRGRFSVLKSHIRERISTPEIQPPRPGGQDTLVLQRALLEGGGMPEFVSATLLPGRGLNTLQITAYLPGKGEVPLLSAPSVPQAAVLMSGSGADASGGASLRMGGAIEVPWAGRIFGTASPDETHIFTQWRGHSLTLPVTSTGPGGGTTASTGGLLLAAQADSTGSSVMPDGGEAQVTFQAGSFGDRWPSQTEVSMTVLLSSHVLDLRVTAKNTGTEATPMGIGWAPRFLIPSGDRNQATLRLPTGDRVERRAPGGMPTGKLVPVEGTAFDHTARGGKTLGPGGMDESFVHLRPAILDFGPAAELGDPKSNYRLRITAMTPAIREMHVTSPAGSNYVVIAPQLNLDDPFGKEWLPGEDTGMVILQPGQSVQWKVRLELFTTTTDGMRL